MQSAQFLEWGGRTPLYGDLGLIEPPRKSVKIIWRISRKLDIRSVRGPKTRNELLKIGYKCPEMYGDPALIMPLIYKPKISKRTNDRICVIKHFCDDMNDSTSGDIVCINPIIDKNEWNTIIDDIASAKLVISSSLHGIIIAEAYGVPAVLLKGSQTDNIFKYEDYYFSTGRNDFKIANSIDEAIAIHNSTSDDNYKNITDNINILREKIINSFPSDIWK